jgi:hypothetical protein
MDLPIILGFMAVALAIFTIGLPHIPPNVLLRMFRGKEPQTKEDFAMIQRFLGIMGVLGFFLFLIMFGFLIGNLTAPVADAIMLHFALNEYISWLNLVIRILFGLVGILIVYWFIHMAWNKALDSVKKQPIAKSDTEKLTESIDKLATLISNIETRGVIGKTRKPTTVTRKRKTDGKR